MYDIDMRDMMERVERGSARLTEYFGSQKWAQNIDIDRLNLGSVSDCILGQLFDDFGTGRYDLKLYELESRELGFDISTELLQEIDIPLGVSYSVLTGMWVAHIFNIRNNVV